MAPIQALGLKLKTLTEGVVWAQGLHIRSDTWHTNDGPKEPGWGKNVLKYIDEVYRPANPSKVWTQR